MNKFNCTINPKQHELIKNELDFLDDIGYGDLNYDAIWKWATILHIIKHFEFLNKEGKNFKCVDIGGGLSPLHFILSNYGEVYNVEMNGFEKTWFPTKNKIYINATDKFKYNKDNIFYIKDDFLKWVKTVEHNSIDFYFDSCSLIHFKPTKINSYNDGIVECMPNIYNSLKKDGLFISASDVAHPEKMESFDMIYPKHLAKCYNICDGLNFYDDNPNWDIDEYFLTNSNFKKRKDVPKNDIHHEHTNKYYDNDTQPIYHLCCTSDVTRKKYPNKIDILRSVFTMIKK